MDMHDFPMVDSLFFVMLKGLLYLTGGEVALSYNLFFLLTFPLTTLSSLFVLRRLGIASGPAVLVSVLYAFLPYHFLRGEGHIFLASYFLVPLAVLLMVRIYLGQSLRWLWALIVCLLLGCGGIYYAFFSCFLLLVAGISSAALHRKLRPLWQAGGLVAVICLSVSANLLPTVLYQAEHGSNPVAVIRDPSHAQMLALKAFHLLMPVDNHRAKPLARIKDRFNQFFSQEFSLERELPECRYATLGVAASIGFLLLLGRLFIRRNGTQPHLPDGLATLNVASLMLACSGGAGALFSFFVTPKIRGYNRISVFIAFFALATLAYVLNRLDRRLQSFWARSLFQVGLALGLVLGILDQCPATFVPPYDALKQTFASEADFVGKIEARIPAGSMIFQLPAVPFPEGPVFYWFGSYDHMRCYVHSHSLRWSFGSIRGREGDRWRTRVVNAPVREMLQMVMDAGFRGIVVDQAYYYCSGHPDPQGEMMRLLDQKPMCSNYGRRYRFYDLSAYATKLQKEATQVDVHVADVNGDGLDDIVGRQEGDWWVARSTGSGFVNERWSHWSQTEQWRNVQVADVNGDGRDDLVGRTGGDWWVARSTGSGFVNERWGHWPQTEQWANVQIADVNGDGRDDLVSRTGGDLLVARSTGSAFDNERWGSWSFIYGPLLSGLVGQVSDGCRLARQGETLPGYLIFGPYAKLPPGRYRYCAQLEGVQGPSDSPVATWDIGYFAEGPPKTLARGEIADGQSVVEGTVELTDDPPRPLEFRVFYSGQGAIAVRSISFRRDG
jgi:phosphoglycerol transferase